MKLFKQLKRSLTPFLSIALIFYFCFQIQDIQAQSALINASGKVVDETGIELPGVNVQVKGEKIGTVTDSKGNFNLKTSTSKTIVFSYIGYQKKEIEASKLNNATVSLELDSKTLTETVVIGYGSVKKKDLNLSHQQLPPPVSRWYSNLLQL